MRIEARERSAVFSGHSAPTPAPGLALHAELRLLKAEIGCTP